MIDETLDKFEVDILEIVGDEFAPKQPNGSPERKRLLGLLCETYKSKQEALTAIYEMGLEVIGADEPDDGFTEDETVNEDGLVKHHRQIRNWLRREQRKDWAKACGVAEK